MAELLKRYRMTAAILTLGAVFTGLAIATDVDVVALNLRALEGIEKNEFDDALLGVLLVIGGLVVDRVRAEKARTRQAALEAARLRTFKATMRTVHDLVGNFLNNLQLIRLDVEDRIPASSLELLDGLVQETAAKLHALGNLNAIVERPAAGGIGMIEAPKVAPVV